MANTKASELKGIFLKEKKTSNDYYPGVIVFEFEDKDYNLTNIEIIKKKEDKNGD